MREILKERRIKNGFTHQGIANALGISRTTYTNIELGYKNPSLLLGLKIKQVLNYNNDNIFLNSECQKGTSCKNEQTNTA